jgi:small conductance mechanosensitive channel
VRWGIYPPAARVAGTSHRLSFFPLVTEIRMQTDPDAAHGAPAANPTSETQPGKTEESATLLQTLESKAPAMIGVILLMILAWILAGWARAASRRALAKTKFDPTLGKFFSNLLRWVIITLAVITSLSLFGVQATGFAAVIGAVTLAIGLGFQNSLSNLAAGVMLLIFRPFKVGDVVNIGGQLGKVNEIDLMMTELDTPDGRRIFVPNGSIFGNVIENITHHPRRRVDIPVGVHYNADVDQTRAALEGALKMIQPRLDDPPPEVILQDLGASSVNWMLRVWTKRDDFFATRQATVRAAKYALDNAGITIPYPQMDVHLRVVGSGAERAVRVMLPEAPVSAS